MYGDFLRPSHGRTSVAVTINKFWKVRSLGSRLDLQPPHGSTSAALKINKERAHLLISMSTSHFCSQFGGRETSLRICAEYFEITVYIMNRTELQLVICGRLFLWLSVNLLMVLNNARLFNLSY